MCFWCFSVLCIFANLFILCALLTPFQFLSFAVSGDVFASDVSTVSKEASKNNSNEAVSGSNEQASEKNLEVAIVQGLPEIGESKASAKSTKDPAAKEDKKNNFWESSSVPDDIKVIVKRGILKVGMCAIDQPPFHVKTKDGEVKGFDIDMANDIAKIFGVKMQLVEAVDWDSVIEMLIDGKVDVMISNLSLTPERAAKIIYSKPYAKIRQCLLLNRVLVARAGSDGLLTLKQIFDQYSGNSLLIQEGTACVDWATSMFPKAKISTTESWDEIMNAILDKKVFGTISDEVEIKERTKQVQAMELMPVIIKGKYDLIVIGLPKASGQLLNVINAYLDGNNVQCNLEE
jgi:ABC-type amino acid transport substrate-binding protein